MKQTEILGIKVNCVDYAQTLEVLTRFVKDNSQHQVVTVNPEFIVAAQTDTSFAKILNEADLAVPDGVGLVWASKLQDGLVRSRVTGTDLVELIAQKAPEQGWSLFLLGGLSGSGERAAQVLKKAHPKLNIKGFFEGDGSPSGDSETLKAVQAAGKIDLLLVAYGQIKQEKWISRNLAKTEAKVAIGVGGAFDFISGQRRRAPGFLRQAGVEWLFRLIQEPTRLKRQLALPKFLYLVLKEKIKSSN